MSIIITPPRYFNSLNDMGTYFIKSSVYIKKITAEIKFYENLPIEVKNFYPKYLGRTSEGKWPTGYKIEKINNHDFSLYFINKTSDKDGLAQNIFPLLKDYFSKIPTKKVTKKEFTDTTKKQIFTRDKERLNTLKSTPIFEDIENLFKESGYKGIEEFLKLIHNKILHLIDSKVHDETWFSHGDLCFSNMLIFKDKLYLIDPRGIFENKFDSYLIPYYDLAKLSQCIFGGYDFINNNIEISFHIDFRKDFQDLVISLGLNFELCRLIECTHFLSMLSLHINSKTKVLRFSKQAIKIGKKFL